MCRGSETALALLGHVSLLLAICGGAGCVVIWQWWRGGWGEAALAVEAAVTRLALPAAVGALLALGHLAAAAAHRGLQRRRALLLAYLVLMLLLVCGEVTWAVWAAMRATASPQGEGAGESGEEEGELATASLRDRLRLFAPLLPTFAADHPGAEFEVPSEVYAALAVATTLLLLQLAAAALALAALPARERAQPRDTLRRSSSVYYMNWQLSK